MTALAPQPVSTLLLVATRRELAAVLSEAGRVLGVTA